MSEALAATLLFWLSFFFSVGPWWAAFMESAKDARPRVLARDFGIYIIVGWLPFLALTAALVRLLGGIHFWFLVGLHFAGGTFILYLGVKTIGAKIGRGRRLNFDWRAMTLLVWSNPKAWLTIPAGSLAATFANSAAINIAAFAAISLPLYVATAIFWRAVAVQGKKISGDKISYVTAALLFSYSAYLLWQGFELATA